MMSVAAARAAARRAGRASSGSACRRTAANLARRLHAPDLVLIYESGTLGAKPDAAAAVHRRRRARRRPRYTVVSVPEVFNYWLQPGRIDVGFLSGAQIDRFGNINTTVIGEYDEPTRAAARRRRRAGDRGVLPRGDRRDAAARRGRSSSRSTSSPPSATAAGRATASVLGLRGRGPTRVITDLGVLEPDPDAKELVLTARAPGRLRRGGAGADGVGAAGVGRPEDHRRRRRSAELRRAALDDDGRLVKLHHADDGPRDAPVLLLAGSLGSTLAMWEPQLTLAGPFRVIRIDHRGHGGSPVPPGPYAMPDLAADVLELLDELELAARWRSAGCRWAGWSACTSARSTRTGSPASRSAAPPRTSPTRRRGTSGSPPSRRTARPGSRTPCVSRWFTPEWAAAHPDVVTALRDQIAGTPDAGYLGCCRAIAAWDHRERLAAVAVPTLVIGGADDLSTPVDPHALHARRGHPRRAAGGAPRRPPRHDRERRETPAG